MSTLRTALRPLAIALTFALTAAPLTAFAEEKAPAPKVQKIDKKRHGKGEIQFPMDSAEFQAHVEARISKGRETMESFLAANPIPDAMKAQIRKDFETGAAAVRAAAKEAAKDGKVTREEAGDVRELARDLKKDARQKYGKSVPREGHKRANKRAG